MSIRILLLTRNESKDEILRYIKKLGEVFVIHDQDDLSSKIQNRKFEICICYCYGPILKKKIINIISCNIINIHPSFLPYGRGIYPILWAAYNNEPFGFSLHLINDEKIDSGPIIYRERIHPNKEITLRELRSKLLKLAINYLVNNFTKILHLKYELINQDSILKINSYKNRKESTLLINKFSKSWDTKIEDIIKYK